MVIRKTEERDVDRITDIFEEARGTIAALGIDQWQNGYPSREVVVGDVESGISYCIEEDGEVRATFVCLLSGEPTYDKIYDGHWLSGDGCDYLAIHRVAISVDSRGRGIASAMIAYAESLALRRGKGSLRIDTHRGNVVMRRMLEKNGFSHCGTILLSDGQERVAYEKVLK